MRIGQMVRRHGGPPMRVTDTFYDMVRCVAVDSHGRVHQHFCYDHELTPMWLSFQPRTLWPDPGNLDLIEIEREERTAEAERKAAQKSSKRSRRSNKIKGRSDAA